jgi:hypothetical protein
MEGMLLSQEPSRAGSSYQSLKHNHQIFGEHSYTNEYNFSNKNGQGTKRAYQKMVGIYIS